MCLNPRSRILEKTIFSSDYHFVEKGRPSPQTLASQSILPLLSTSLSLAKQSSRSPPEEEGGKRVGQKEEETSCAVLRQSFAAVNKLVAIHRQCITGFLRIGTPEKLNEMENMESPLYYDRMISFHGNRNTEPWTGFVVDWFLDRPHCSIPSPTSWEKLGKTERKTK